MYPPKGRVLSAGSATRTFKTTTGSTSPSPSTSSASLPSHQKKASVSKAAPSKLSVATKTGGHDAARKSRSALTVLPAEEEAACSTVEPLVEFETGNLPEPAMKHNYSVPPDMELMNCQSIAIREGEGNSTTSCEEYPDFTVQDPESSSETFLSTLKTLVDITSFRNSDMEPLSNATSGTDDGDGFSIVTPIRDATYDLIRSSSRFIRGTIDGEDDEETATKVAKGAAKGTDPAASTATPKKGASDSTWNLQGLSNWL
ncbi:G- coupled receptor 98, putative [Babesia ovata]|uniref:G-coupled receptor 98, putative n=1 Tax=Babesia ovata TaxID=189622 RepID=A0A2H6KEY3_9APIC|nr:G- coupled receptor 98, putative [Babesia ovata]GBE61560.1 G- coupled receptor 98, putative [Babesia ovata]